MKMYRKEELSLKNGLLVSDDGDVVVVDPDVITLANNLETDLQKARYLAAQPSGIASPSLEGFHRKSMDSIQKFTCDTPLSDKKAEEAIAFMDELDDIKLTDEMNKHLMDVLPLVMFAQDEEVLDTDCKSVRRFDTPMLGNPLEWTEDTINVAIAEIHGCSVSDDSDGQSE